MSEQEPTTAEERGVWKHNLEHCETDEPRPDANNCLRLIADVERLEKQVRLHELAADLPDDVNEVLLHVLAGTVSYEPSVPQIQQAIVRAQRAMVAMETEMASERNRWAYLRRHAKAGWKCAEACKQAADLYGQLSLSPLEAAAKYGDQYEGPSDTDCLEMRQTLDDAIACAREARLLEGGE